MHFGNSFSSSCLVLGIKMVFFFFVCRLKGYSVETAIGVIEDGGTSLKINTQHLRDVSFRVGSIYQFIGELHIDPNNEVTFYLFRAI